MKRTILTKEQLAYKLNLNPDRFLNTKEMLAWWRLYHPIRIKEEKKSWFKRLINKIK